MRFRLILCWFVVAALVVPGAAAENSDPADQPRFSILVFTKTEGYRHRSITAGKRALQELGRKHDFGIDTTESASEFTPDRLEQYDVVVFLNTSGNVLSAAQEQAFEAYVESGGGFVGIHSAAATEYDWEWYNSLIGAHFDDHPEVQKATVHVSDPVHPATRDLPVAWTRTDEWYNYRSNPRGRVHVLATVDEQSYEGGTMGPDHPIAWAHEMVGGRSFYTGGGHKSENFRDPHFRMHLLGGIEWAAGQADGSAAATINSSYEKVVLDSTTTDPMDLDVAPDGRVFYVERRGIIRIWDPESERRVLAGYLPVYTGQEDGLISIALSPDFSENRWVYLYYSPVNGPPRNQLSRFRVIGNRIDLKSEQVILEVPTQRKQCCHTGGSIAFGPNGDLVYLSTGDDTNPFGSSGFTPVDEREDRKYWDAQRTSANTQDLRGKILRINPQPDGSYTIPEGNLFSDPERGRPEIYTMGHRNPYRISVDKDTGWLYWGDIGPDAGAPDSARGPAGLDEFNQAREAGNYGWPYFIGDNASYHDYDFAADTSGPEFDPRKPVNTSPNNTGARRLPPAKSAMIWYPYGPSEEFPEIGVGSRSAMVGPVYHYSPDSVGPRGLPAYFDESLLIYEWGRNWIRELTFDSTGHPAAVNPLFTDKSFIRPMDVEIGPDGRLYVLQWGNNFGGGPNSEIIRLDYYGSPERPPYAKASASSETGPAPRTVTLQADTAGQHHPSADLRYAWDLDGDGTTERHGAAITHTYESRGTHTARLTVIDENGLSATDEVSVVVGNTAPTISFEWPLPGGIIPFDEPIPYRVTVSDPEDGDYSNERIEVSSFIGRDSHELPIEDRSGSAGTISIARGNHYEPKERLYGALQAQYTDGGAPGVDSLKTRTHIRLHPKHVEAEFAPRKNVAQQKTVNGDDGRSRTVVTLRNGHYVGFSNVNLRNIDTLSVRVAPMAGGRIEIRRATPQGPILGEVAVSSADTDSVEDDTTASARDYSDVGTSAGDWQSIRIPVEKSPGSTPLYLVFRGLESAPLFQLDWLRFVGPGMTEMPSSIDSK